MNKSVQFLEYYFVMEIKKLILDVHCLVATTLDKYLNGYISVLLVAFLVRFFFIYTRLRAGELSVNPMQLSSYFEQISLF